MLPCGDIMKLMINYDFIEAVRNVNEPLGPLKVIRNNKRQWFTINLPLYFTLDYLFYRNITSALEISELCFILMIGTELTDYAINKEDLYHTKSSHDLKRLVPKLNDLNIKTDYNLLLQSEMYERKYKIEFNDNKIPSLMEEKYILLPSYNYSGEIKDTSLLQEHIIGSREYELSIGTPAKTLKLVHSNA